MNKIIEKTEVLEIDPSKTDADAFNSTMKDEKTATVPNLSENQPEKEKLEGEDENESVEDKKTEPEESNKHGEKDKQVSVVIEPKTGVSFPVTLADKTQLNAVGYRKKSLLGIGIKVYGFGIYADNEKLKDLLRTKIGKPPSEPTNEMYQAVIDSDIGMTVRLVIVFPALTMSLVRTNFNETLGASVKKLTGVKNDELAKMVMAKASDDIKLTPGSVIEISRFPGYNLQTKVRDEILGTVQNELLSRAYFHMYLGDEPFDKEAKEKFGMSMLSLL